MSTPFDNEFAIFLNKIQKIFKIASADITNFPLVEQILKFKNQLYFLRVQVMKKKLTN